MQRTTIINMIHKTNDVLGLCVMSRANTGGTSFNFKWTISHFSKAPNTYSTVRLLNILLVGIEEDKNANVWQQIVLDVLKFVAGEDLDTIDMFRLGRFATNKVRPVIVKLRTFWDKRILLSSSYKLKSCVFLVADEPIDVQRKNTSTRLKTRAENDGKLVEVQNGVLIVDNIAIFFLGER